MRTLQVSVGAMTAHWLFHWPLTGVHAMGWWLTPALCAYFVFVFHAPWSWGLPIWTRLPTNERMVALTFDDGPSPECTPRILDILAEYHARATFFVLGENARRCPDLLCRMVSEGHRIGIHGERHEPFVLRNWRSVAQDIACVRQAIQDVCPRAVAPVWLRPPHGFKTWILPWIARRMGCSLVAWSVNGRDYRARDAAEITTTVLSHAHPGAIVLLHDGAANALTVEALPAILAGLAASGYRCATLEETKENPHA